MFWKYICGFLISRFDIADTVLYGTADFVAGFPNLILLSFYAEFQITNGQPVSLTGFQTGQKSSHIAVLTL